MRDENKSTIRSRRWARRLRQLAEGLAFTITPQSQNATVQRLLSGGRPASESEGSRHYEHHLTASLQQKKQWRRHLAAEFSDHDADDESNCYSLHATSSTQEPPHTLPGYAAIARSHRGPLCKTYWSCPHSTAPHTRSRPHHVASSSQALSILIPHHDGSACQTGVAALPSVCSFGTCGRTNQHQPDDSTKDDSSKAC
jgi:hypothetical protein